MADDKDDGCGMVMYTRYPKSEKRLRCEQHDENGHHYAPSSSNRDPDPEKMRYVLFRRSTLERLLISVILDNEYATEQRSTHPDNDGDPLWTPVLGIDNVTIVEVLRTRDVILSSEWLRDALNMAARLGEHRERDRVVKHMHDRLNVNISLLPGIYPAGQEPRK